MGIFNFCLVNSKDILRIAMDQHEKTILDLIKKGDKQIFYHLFELYYKRLFLYARSYLDHSAEAEDIVQDLFVHIWEKRKEIVIFSSLSSYLFCAVHNRCLQVLRHKKVIASHEDKHKLKIREAEILYNSTADFFFSEQQVMEIRKIYEKTNATLPSKTREIFRLSREQMKSNKEIAEQLDIQIKTVEYHITKALKILYVALKDFFILFIVFRFLSN